MPPEHCIKDGPNNMRNNGNVIYVTWKNEYFMYLLKYLKIFRFIYLHLDMLVGGCLTIDLVAYFPFDIQNLLIKLKQNFLNLNWKYFEKECFKLY